MFLSYILILFKIRVWTVFWNTWRSRERVLLDKMTLWRSLRVYLFSQTSTHLSVDKWSTISILTTGQTPKNQGEVSISKCIKLWNKCQIIGLPQIYSPGIFRDNLFRVKIIHSCKSKPLSSDTLRILFRVFVE